MKKRKKKIAKTKKKWCAGHRMRANLRGRSPQSVKATHEPPDRHASKDQVHVPRCDEARLILVKSTIQLGDFDFESFES